MSTIANLTVALNADVGGFTGTMASATRSINAFKKMGQTVFQETRTPLEQYQSSLKRLQALYHGGQVNADTFGRAVRKLNDEFRASQSSGLGGQFASGILGFSTGVGATIVAANAVIGAIKGVSSAAVDAGASALKLAADFERAEISFTTLFKSAAVAKQVMAEVKQFAAITPFEFPELKDAAVKLAGFGITAKELVPTLKVLGDISAGTGANINELAETYGKARIQGRAYTRDVNEFANRGVPIWEALNKVMGTNSAETHKLVEDGKVGFRELQQAVISLTQSGGLFEGGLEAQSKSLYGLYSTIHDNLNLALGELGEKATGELGLKELAKDAIELTNALKTDGVPVLIEFGKGLGILASAGNETLTMLTGIDLSVKGLTQTIYGANSALLQWQLANAKLFGSSEQVLEIQKQLVDLAVRAAGLSPAPKAPGAPELEPGGNATDIDKEIAALERQAEMVGKSAQQKKLAELVTKGLLEADMEYAAELIRQTEEQTAFIAAEEQTRKTMESHIAALKQQADTFGMSARQADLYRQKLAGATAEELKAMEAQYDRLQQQKEMLDEVNQREERDRKFQDEIGRITERNLTPLEKFTRDMEHLTELRSHGLNDEQFGREAARLKEELDDATKPQGRERNARNTALVAGTSEFYSAINRSVVGSVKDPAARDRKQNLAIQQRNERHLRNIDNASKKQQVANF